MTQLVNLPDGSQASFPDGTPPAVMKAAIQKKFPPPIAAASAVDPGLALPNQTPQTQPQPNLLQQAGQVASQMPMLAPFTQGIPALAKTLGMDNTGRNPMDALATMGEKTFESVPIAGPALHNAGEQARAWVGKNIYGDPNSTPQTAAAQDRARNASYPEAAGMGELAGPTAAFLLASRIPGAPVALGLEGSLASRLGLGLGSQYGINTADELAHGKSLGDALVNSVVPTAEAAPFFLFGGGKTTKPTIGPSTGELKADAGKIYDQARASGVEMPQSGTIALSDNMFQVARDAGIISPTGAVAKGYGKIGDVLDHLDQYANGTMTVPQMQATRKLLQDAAGSIDKGERRVGTMMLKAFDGVVAQGVPQLAEAAPIYHRAMKGQTLDTAISKAAQSASQFSNSGSDNALRTKFRQISNKIEDGKLKGFSTDEKAAINNVANGSVLGNALRYAGKFAPTGVVPFLGSGGVGAMADLATGNHALGAGAALGTMLLGGAGRIGADAVTSRAAKIAAALTKRGGPAPLVDRTGIMASPLPNLMGRALLAQ